MNIPEFKKEDLHPDLVEHIFQSPHLGDCLQHPLVYSVPYHAMMNCWLNQSYEYKKSALKEALENKNWSSYIYLHERPYRLVALFDIYHQVADSEFWPLFFGVWEDSENIWQYQSIFESCWMRDIPGRLESLSEEDQTLYAQLPDEFVIYRGHQQKNRTGMSWSLSYTVADWFSRRWATSTSKPNVVTAICKKSDVLGIFTGRSEMEIVVNPNNLDIKNYSKLRRPTWIQTLLNDVKLNNKDKYHGPSHWDKVERNVIKLAKLVPQSDVVVGRLFAILHDSCREINNRDEGDDPKHGMRAAEFAKKLWDDKELPISEAQLQLLVEACHDHNQGTISDNPTVGICWDADRLDLPRVGIVPDPKFLSTTAAKELIWKI